VSYTIVSNVCEGVADCMTVCPVECIVWAREGPFRKLNPKGVAYAGIDDSVCVDCGACMAVCPIEGAILDRWEPHLQNPEPARVAPDELEFEAEAGSWRWFLRLQGNRLSIVPSTAPDQGIVEVSPTRLGWIDFWEGVHRIGIASWHGDYVERAGVPNYAGLQWRLRLSKGQWKVDCSGGGLPRLAPPGFYKILQEFVLLIESSVGSATRPGAIRTLDYIGNGMRPLDGKPRHV
jgi:NAD-dependent dihydropyrimidine dehydrogenase PreA subunit